MLSSRVESFANIRLSELTDQELRWNIANDVLKWKNLLGHVDGRITGDCPTLHHIAPKTVPDFVNHENAVLQLEAIIKHEGWWLAYCRQLDAIAGSLNPLPTRRQRCEAALLTARLSAIDR